MKVYLLYEGDCWLTKKTLTLIGVFTTDEKLLNAVREYVSRNIENFRYASKRETLEDVQERIVEEFCDNDSQTQKYCVNLLAKEVTTDALYEV